MNAMSRRSFGVASAAAVAGASLIAAAHEPDDRPPVCKRIQQSRESQGLTVAECAEASGVTKADWLAMEAGTEPDGIQAARAAKTLGVGYHWLAIGEGE